MKYIEAMKIAINQAQQGVYESNEVPVGAVVLDSNNKLISKKNNQRELLSDPTAHAEILALRDASKKLGSWRLNTCTLVVTLEPCLMCAGAIVQSRIGRIVFGAWDEKAGACGSVWDVLRDGRAHHSVEVVSEIMIDECSLLLKNFFSQIR